MTAFILRVMKWWLVWRIAAWYAAQQPHSVPDSMCLPCCAKERRRAACKHKKILPTSHGLAFCKDCEKVFTRPQPNRFQRVISMFD